MIASTLKPKFDKFVDYLGLYKSSHLTPILSQMSIDNTVTVLEKLMDILPDLPAPQVQTSDEKEVLLSWHKDNHSIELDISEHGGIEFYYRNSVTDEVYTYNCSTQNMDYYIVSDKIKWLI